MYDLVLYIGTADTACNEDMQHRQTDRQTVLVWDRNPHTLALFQAGSAYETPRYWDLQGSHQLIMDVERYYASPAGSRRLMAPPVKCEESRCSDVYLTERLEVGPRAWV